MCQLLCILSCWEANKESCDDKGGAYNLLEPDETDRGCKESIAKLSLFLSPTHPLQASPSLHLLNCSFPQLSKAIRAEAISLLSPLYTCAVQ